MVAPRNDKLHVGNAGRNLTERFNHQFQLLVRAPFSECQNAMNRIATS
jgi:hypothetical protein